MPKPDVLLILDLDNTIFNYHAKELVFFGGQKFWENLSQHLTAIVEGKGGRLVLGVVTNKKNFDFFCAEAAKAFRPFFAKHNPHMYDPDNPSFCLARDQGVLKYADLFSSKERIVQDETLSCSFEILFNQSKVLPAFRIADSFNIPHDHMICIDDTPYVLKDYEAEGIMTVSAEAFFATELRFLPGHSEHEAYIAKALATIYEQAIQKVTQLVENATRQLEKTEKKPSMVSFEPADTSVDKPSSWLFKHPPLQEATRAPASDFAMSHGVRPDTVTDFPFS